MIAILHYRNVGYNVEDFTDGADDKVYINDLVNY